MHEVIAGRLAPTKVPLDMPGGPFHKGLAGAVRVPWGETVSYAELAEKAGNPRASRAAPAPQNRWRLSSPAIAWYTVGAEWAVTSACPSSSAFERGQRGTKERR